MRRPPLVVLVLVVLAVSAALVGLPFVQEDVGLSAFYIVLLSTFFFWTAQATSWNVLSGYSGYFSFGQGAFVGLGAYTVGVMVGRNEGNFYVAMAVATGLSAVLAALVGALAFRLRSFRGEIFALLTLAVPFILSSLARLNESIDGGQGIIVPVPDFPEGIGRFQDFLYLLNLVIAIVAVVVALVIQHSRLGWALAAIRDAEDVAEGLGVPTFLAKMVAIVATGVLGGAAGAAFALQIGFVTVEAVFGLTIPLFVIVMCVLGGRTHWLGPVIGALLIVTLQDRLASSGLEGWRLVILGSVLVVVVVAAPDGLQPRLRARPWASLAAFVVATLAAVVFGLGDEEIDQAGVGMAAAALVALWPGRAGVRAFWRPSALDHALSDASSLDGERRPEPAAVSASAAAALGDDESAPVDDASSDVPPVGEPLIECRNVAKSFGGVQALSDITLDIHSGEIVGLVGPNGSGKTTLVNLLAGSSTPTTGVIRLDGRDIGHLAPHRIAHAGVARTYQTPRPFESMTVRDNVAMSLMFGRHPRRLAQARDEARAHLEFIGFASRIDARPAEINLHERLLLEMARAIASNPKVLLLDEALAGLNPAEIDNAVAVVRRIHASGITIVIVEHLLRVVNQLATRVVVLDQGRCLADGDPQTVMRDPAVVRAYLGRQAHAGRT
ncbi:MAG: branched-chain amino acid ABC transporter ATP-binding protein/permease [Acidimicrobiales bacterium]